MIQQFAELEPVAEQPAASTVQKHYRVSEVDLPTDSFSGRLIQHVEQLEQLGPAWNRLLETSIRVNPYFDPDFLIPAISQLGNGNVSVLAVEATQRINAQAPPVLCALFPVVRRRIYGIPLNSLEIWRHDLGLDCTPLIRRDCAAEVLEFIFEFVGQELGISLLSMSTVIGEGPFCNLLSDSFYRHPRAVFRRDEFTRSCFKPMADAETFINTNVAKNTRKGSQRLRRKLAQRGVVETGFLSHYDQTWVDEFLSLESAGWKGANGTALASNPSTRHFFHEMAERMLQNGKMVMARTSFDGRPIAMFCDLQLASRGAHFKTTFDEDFKEYSPGLFVELDNIDRLHDCKIEFVDSCADPDHSMINRVWPDRVRFQSLIVALRGPLSQAAASGMPLIQQFWKFVNNNKRKRK